MSTGLGAIPEAEIDRLRELAHIGASWAATSFARLVGRTILTRVPVVHAPERFVKRGEWQTAILCEMRGSLDESIFSKFGAAAGDLWHNFVAIFTPETTSVPVIMLFVIVSLASTYPAVKAAWISPIEAMHHQ